MDDQLLESGRLGLAVPATPRVEALRIEIVRRGKRGDRLTRSSELVEHLASIQLRPARAVERRTSAARRHRISSAHSRATAALALLHAVRGGNTSRPTLARGTAPARSKILGTFAPSSTRRPRHAS